MCITVSPANLSSTITGIVFGKKGLISKHYLIYQNTAKSESPQDSNGNSPNCMPLYVRGTDARGIDASDYSEFATRLVSGYITLTETSRGYSTKGRSTPGISIQECGDYTLLFCNGASKEDIKAAFNRVPKEKKVEISDELLAFYLERYDDCTLVLCFFTNSVEKKMTPIIIEYTPLEYDCAIIPGVDSHTGGVPKKDKVNRDHFIFFGLPKEQKDNSYPTMQVFQKAHFFSYDKVPIMPDFLTSSHYFVEQKNYATPNCDWIAIYDQENERAWIESYRL